MLIDSADQTNIKYAVTVSCTVPQVGELEFAFSNVPPTTIQLTMTASDEGDGGGYTITANAKIEILTDNTWSLSISYDGGTNYTETANGTWAMSGYTGMILTVATDEADVLAESSYNIVFDTETTPGSIIYTSAITCTVPQVGALGFDFTATLAM